MAVMFSSPELIRLNKSGFTKSFEFLGLKFSLKIPLDDCVKFVDKENPNINELFHKYVASTPELISRAVAVIKSGEVEQSSVKKSLSQKFSYPEFNLNPLFDELKLNEGSFEFILNQYLNPKIQPYSLEDFSVNNGNNINFKSELENNKQYIYNFIQAKYRSSHNKVIDRLNDIYNLNDDSNNLVLFILKDINFFARNFMGLSYGVLEKEKTSQVIWDYCSKNGKDILFRELIDSINLIIFKKQTRSGYRYGKYELESYQTKRRIEKEVFNFSVSKILKFLNFEEFEAEIKQDINKCVDLITKDYYHKNSVLSNSVYFNIKIDKKGPFVVPHNIISQCIKYIFDEESVEVLSSDVENFEEISNIFNKYFLEKYSKLERVKKKKSFCI